MEDEYTYLVMLGYGRDESAPTPCGMFVGVSWCVRSVIGSPSAAVGADLSCPHIRKHLQNEERKCVCDKMNIWI
ncbi:hypothetical protein [Prevotella pallens]